MNEPRVNIIHLSDLHFGKVKTLKKNGNELKKIHLTFKSLIQKIAEIHRKNPIDYIVISGDVGFSGDKSNYSRSKGELISSGTDFIESFNEALFPESIPKFIICPGNHDIKIKDFEPGRKKVLPVRKRDKLFKDVVNGGLVKSPEFKTLLKDFSAYSRFLDDNGKVLKPTFRNKELKGLSGYIYCPAEDLAFVIINSAWLSNPNRETDYEKLIVSKNVVTEIYDEVCKLNPGLVITVMHHPPYWLEWSERFGNPSSSGPVMQHITHQSEILLTGHEHCNILPPDSMQSRCLLFTTGAAFEKPENNTEFYFNSFQFLQVDKRKNDVEQSSFRMQSGGDRYVWVEEAVEQKRFSYVHHKNRRQIFDFKNYRPLNFSDRLESFSEWAKTCALQHEIINYNENKDINLLITEIKDIFEQSNESIVRLRIDKKNKEIYRNLKSEFKDEIQANICILEPL